MNAISGRRAPTITAPAVGCSSLGPKSGVRPSAEPRSQLLRSASTEERRPAAGRELAVEEHGQAELAEPAAELPGRRLRALHVGRLQRHKWDDIGRADPRVGTLVSRQVDPVAGNLDGADERLDERAVLPHHREYRAMVIGVRVHVQKPHTL